MVGRLRCSNSSNGWGMRSRVFSEEIGCLAELCRCIEQLLLFSIEHGNTYVRNGINKKIWHQTKIQLSYIVLSFLGLLVLTIMMLSLSYPQRRIPQQSFFVTSLFVLICILGIVAAIFPNFFSRLDSSNKSRFRGHHPICIQFKNHVLQWKEKVLCSGCTGLAIGAVLAIIYSVFYNMSGELLKEKNILFWIGFILSGLGLIQHFIDMEFPIIHLILNIFLVLGSSMLLFYMDSIGVSISIASFHLSLILFWIITRIRLSQHEHIKVCIECGLECEDSF